MPSGHGYWLAAFVPDRQKYPAGHSIGLTTPCEKFSWRSPGWSFRAQNLKKKVLPQPMLCSVEETLSAQQWQSKTTWQKESKLLEKKQMKSWDATYQDHFVHPSRQTYLLRYPGCSTENDTIKGKVIWKQNQEKQPFISKDTTQSTLRQREIHMSIPEENIKRKQQIYFTYIPTGHVSHWLLPAWSWYFPEGQGMGSGLPVGQ